MLDRNERPHPLLLGCPGSELFLSASTCKGGPTQAYDSATGMKDPAMGWSSRAGRHPAEPTADDRLLFDRGLAAPVPEAGTVARFFEPPLPSDG
jgi:hypothetical protein